MFEKISPPAGGPIPSANGSSNSGSGPSIAKKPHGVIVQILGRLVETRVKRTLREEKGVVTGKPPK
jgi:hypothetical protein